jgi:hypothetical protein
VQPLTPSDLSVLRAQDGTILFRNQAAPSLRGAGSRDAELTHSSDLEWLEAERQYRARYIIYRQITLLQAGMSANAWTLASSTELTGFERAAVSRLLEAAIASLNETDAQALARLPAGVKLSISYNNEGLSAVGAERSGAIHFPAVAIRQSFARCASPILEVDTWMESEQACRNVGGEPRESVNWQSVWNSDFESPLDGGTRTTVNDQERSRRLLKPLLCDKVRDSSKRRKLATQFAQCFTDGLWFLTHHKLAHYFSAPPGKQINDNEYVADCLGLTNATKSRPKSSLGAFEDVVDAAGGSPNAQELNRRRYRLKNELMPLALDGRLTPNQCLAPQASKPR